MIIQTGMRTDIPAFYSEWFANRLRAGYVYVRNPYNQSQVTKYQLNPEVVDVIGFCSKNPEPMLRYMNLLQPYGQYWFVTITPYGSEIEPYVPPVEKVLNSFIRLSEIVGADSMGWRYDPIFLSEKYSIEFHKEQFEQMAEKLDGYTHTCVISFLDLYEKTKRNFPEGMRVTREQRMAIGKELIWIAKNHHMTIRPCAEGDELAAFGADCTGCMTKETYETAIHGRLKFPGSMVKSQRPECACVFGRDIGQYNSCGHFCRYCYANTDRESVIRNMRMHDPASPFLIGHSMPDDMVHEAEQSKWRDDQMTIFDLYPVQGQSDDQRH